MAFDAHKNLAIASIAVAPSPAVSGTTVTLTAGQGGRMPAVPFNATVWPASALPDPVTAEVVRVTARTGDVCTIARTQEGTAARTIVAGDLFAATITAKWFADLESGTNFPAIDAPTVTASGSLLAGTGTAAGTGYAQVQPGTVTISNPGTGAGYPLIFKNANGTVGYVETAGSTTTYSTTSDNRLKDDQGAVRDARSEASLAVLRQTVVHDFTWKSDGRPGRGVFAQEAFGVVPFVVTVGTDATDEAGHLVHPWGVDYGKYVPDLIVGWQQHEAQVAALTAQITALEARLAALEAAAAPAE